MYMRDDKFYTTVGKVNLHPTKETHWVRFVNEIYFGSYGCSPPLNTTNHIKKVHIETIKFRKTTVVAQLIVCMFHI